MRKGQLGSPLGRLLTLTGYLGRLRMLAEHGLVDDQDPEHFTDLAPYAQQLYAALASRSSGAGNDV